MTVTAFVVLLAAAGASGAGPASEEGEAPYSACLYCHENLPGQLSAVVAEWRQSVHHANQVTCHGCHGGDATVRPEQFKDEDAFKSRSHLSRGKQFLELYRPADRLRLSVRGRTISYFCGQCHADIKEKHLGSPHGELGEPSCLYCHGRGSHAIVEPSVEIIDTRPLSEGGRCATCHRAATMETVASVKKVLKATEGFLEEASKQYAWLEDQGYRNLELEQMFHHSRETASRLRQTFHSFNMREINNFASAIKSNADLTDQTYEIIHRLERAKSQQVLIGSLAVLFLLAFVGLLVHYRLQALSHD